MSRFVPPETQESRVVAHQPLHLSLWPAQAKGPNGCVGKVTKMTRPVQGRAALHISVKSLTLLHYCHFTSVGHSCVVLCWDQGFFPGGLGTYRHQQVTHCPTIRKSTTLHGSGAWYSQIFSWNRVFLETHSQGCWVHLTHFFWSI